MARAVERRGGLRYLNEPRPATVRVDHETKEPCAVYLNQRWCPVTTRDRWLIEDGWWRTPIRRMYFEVITDDGLGLELFWDLEGRQWFSQWG